MSPPKKASVPAPSDRQAIPFETATAVASRTSGGYGLLESLIEPVALVATLFGVAVVIDEGIDVPYLVVGLLVFAVTSQGKSRNFFAKRKWWANIFANWAFLYVTLMFCLWVTHQLVRFDLQALLTWGVAAPVIQLAATLSLRTMFPRLAHGPRRSVVVGVNPQSVLLARRHADDDIYDTRLVGFFDDRPRDRLPDFSDYPLLGSLDDVADFVRQNLVHDVYISLPIASQARSHHIIKGLRNSTASVHFILDTYLMDMVQGHIGTSYGIPTLSICESPFIGIDGLVKRSFDIVASSIILLMLSPALIAIAAAIKLTSPGPVIFKQRRYGLDGKEIYVYKFRSMRVTEDGDRTYKQVEKNDPRLTRLGAFLRKTSLDELPQFINVLEGKMSIVGPRPHAIAVNEHYRHEISGYMIRHKVRPGITGWAQVNGFRGGDDIESMRARVECDLEYLRHWSLRLDLYIIFRTVAVVYRDQHAF